MAAEGSGPPGNYLPSKCDEIRMGTKEDIKEGRKALYVQFFASFSLSLLFSRSLKHITPPLSPWRGGTGGEASLLFLLLPNSPVVDVFDELVAVHVTEGQ